MNGERDEAMDRRLEWALGESEGAAKAPDVSQQVMARLATGEEIEMEEPPSRSGRWLAAAVMLLGLGAVIGVWVMQHGQVPVVPVAPVQQPVAPKAPTVVAEGRAWVTVQSRAALEALPADTVRIEGINLGDECVPGLRRFTRLEGLRLLVREAPQVHAVSKGAAEILGELSSLRVLHLDHQEALSNQALDFLAKLTKLTELRLAGFDTMDGVFTAIAKLTSLERLELDDNWGFERNALVIVSQLPRLRALSMRGCCQIDAEMLAPIGSMRDLEELLLGRIPDMRRNLVPGSTMPLARNRMEPLTDAALVWLRDKSKLRRLDLGWAFRLTDDGLRVLADLPALTDLSLAATGRLTAATLGQLPDSLRRLDLTACDWFDAEAVRALPTGLHELDLTGCTQVDDAAIGAALARCPQLEKVEVANCAEVTDAGRELLRRAAEAKNAKPAPSGVLEVRTPEDITKNPTARFVRLLDSSAKVTAVLDQIAQCESLDIDRRREVTHSGSGLLVPLISDEERRAMLDDGGLSQIAKLTKLRRLYIAGNEPVVGTTLAALARLPVLEVLDLRQLRIEDEALSGLPSFPALRELLLESNIGLTDAGLDVLARCQALRRLSLAACPHLDLARLGQLHQIEQLELTGIKAGTQMVMTGDQTDPHWAEICARAATAAFLLDGNLGDRALAGLQSLTKLRRLTLREGTFTRQGLAALLPKLTSLEYLDLTGCSFFTTADVAYLPASVREFVFHNCPEVDDATLDALKQRPWQDAIFDFRGCPKVTEKGMSKMSGFFDISSSRVSLASPLQVMEVADLRRRPNAQSILLLNTSPEVLAALSLTTKCQTLDARVPPPQSGTERKPLLTDEGLQEIAKLRDLTDLDLGGQSAITARGLARLTAIPSLKQLHLGTGPLTDDALAAVAKLPSLSKLSIDKASGFTNAGLAALAQSVWLRELGLTASAPIDRAHFAALGQLRQLELLALGTLPSPMSFDEQNATAAFPAENLLDDSMLLHLYPLTQLQGLALYQGGFTRAGLTALLAKLPNLKALCLDGWQPFHTADVALLPSGLTIFSAANCLEVDDATLAALARQCPDLKNVIVRGCPGVTAKGLQELRAMPSNPQVQSLPSRLR